MPRDPDRPRNFSGIDPLDASTWPSHCPKPDCGIELTKPRQCMGHSKRAPHKHCQKSAAEGQHVCVRHGARAPRSVAAAKRRLARAELEGDMEKLLESLEMRATGRPVVDLLLDAVYRFAAIVELFGARVTGVHVEALATSGDVEAYGVWLDRLAKASSLALRAGVEERKVQLAEQQAQLLAKVISGILGDLGHDLHDPEVREAVTTHLQLVRAA